MPRRLSAGASLGRRARAWALCREGRASGACIPRRGNRVNGLRGSVGAWVSLERIENDKAQAGADRSAAGGGDLQALRARVVIVGLVRVGGATALGGEKWSVSDIVGLVDSDGSVGGVAQEAGLGCAGVRFQEAFGGEVREATEAARGRDNSHGGNQEPDRLPGEHADNSMDGVLTWHDAVESRLRALIENRLSRASVSTARDTGKGDLVV